MQNLGGPAAVIGSQGNIPLGNWEGCRDDDLKPEYSPWSKDILCERRSRPHGARMTKDKIIKWVDI